MSNKKKQMQLEKEDFYFFFESNFFTNNNYSLNKENIIYTDRPDVKITIVDANTGVEKLIGIEHARLINTKKIEFTSAREKFCHEIEICFNKKYPGMSYHFSLYFKPSFVEELLLNKAKKPNITEDIAYHLREVSQGKVDTDQFVEDWFQGKVSCFNRKKINTNNSTSFVTIRSAFTYPQSTDEFYTTLIKKRKMLLCYRALEQNNRVSEYWLLIVNNEFNEHSFDSCGLSEKLLNDFSLKSNYDYDKVIFFERTNRGFLEIKV